MEPEKKTSEEEKKPDVPAAEQKDEPNPKRSPPKTSRRTITVRQRRHR